MPKEQVLVNDIIAEHRERMLNLKKYYPFFRLSEISFSWFMDGKYDNLDMGYILMAVLRFFIEENNFKEQAVTYSRYAEFMTECLKRDFDIVLEPEDNKVLVDYIFDKLKNDGKPFSFTYYDPVDKVKKISRVKLLESRIQDGTVWYSISSDGIEFYLDTKEIKDESKISIEQLLLEKMIQSEDFRGGTQVVMRINQEVERLWYRKNQVIELLTADVFSGMEAYQYFFDTGIKWFDEEQKLFNKNKELIEAALRRAENEKIAGDAGQFYRTANEIYRLDTELKVAMSNHSELLKACTDLGIKADEIVRKHKLSRLRSSFDFKAALERMIKGNNIKALEFAVHPFLGLNIKKTFGFSKIDDMLSYRPEMKEVSEKVVDEPEQEIVFRDEVDNERFISNAGTLILIMLEFLQHNKEITFSMYHEAVTRIFADNILKNGDYYAFLVHFCGKKEYIFSEEGYGEETFLDEMIREFMTEPKFEPYKGMHIELEFSEDAEEIEIGNFAKVTEFKIRRV